MIKSITEKSIRLLQLDDAEVFLQTALRMILLMLLLFVTDIFLAGIIVPLLVFPGLFINRVLLNRYYWLALALIFTVTYLVRGLDTYTPNHKYIFSFLLIAVAVSMFVRHFGGSWRDFLSRSARWIIGFCFLYATLGKFLAPEFINGSFFEFTCLTDERFHGMTSLFSGIDTSTLYAGYTKFMGLLTTNDLQATVALQSADALRPVSLGLAYWTIFIEGMIAISFLVPQRFALHRYREWFLLAFIITTYPVATVPGFATTLAIMAFIQTYKNDKANFYSLLYIFIFLSIPLFRLPFIRIWEVIT